MPSFARSLNVIARCTQMQRDEALKELNLRGSQVPYLLELSRRPGLSQEELARALYVNKSTVARQITNLEKSGYVERRPSTTDRRCLLVYPTQFALDTLPQLRTIVYDWNQFLMEEFCDEEREMLRTMMNRIAVRAKGYIEREVGWDS